MSVKPVPEYLYALDFIHRTYVTDADVSMAGTIYTVTTMHKTMRQLPKPPVENTRMPVFFTLNHALRR